MRILLALCVVMPLWLGAASAAQDQRYGVWTPAPDPLAEMTSELRRLVDEAARARAADPRFLKDLRDLANRFTDPWPVGLVREDFSDGDFTANPNWRVISGEFVADALFGLRSTVAAPPAAQPREEKVSREELALRLFGQILNRGGSREKQPAPPPAAPAVPAEITLTQSVSNAFSLTATLRLEAGSGPLTLGFVQRRDTGYFLVFGGQDALQLQRRGAGGSVVLASAVAALADNTDHVLRWTRGENGEMVVALDDGELLRATDTGFRDRWASVTLVNGGGTMTLRSLNLSGSR